MKLKIMLRGITWDHTRGLVPLVAAAQRFHERNQKVTISWDARSLKAFGDESIEYLSESFDFLVIDHPFVGYASANPDILLPLDRYLPPAFLTDQAANSVGHSYESYCYGGHQWALAIDAAAPVAAWRNELLASSCSTLPNDWAAVLDLAHSGLVALPATATEALLALFPLCIARGSRPFQSKDEFVVWDAGIQALEDLFQLITICGPENLVRNPIQTYEMLASPNSREVYCPMAYGYSNYARRGYASTVLSFGPAPNGVDGMPLQTTLGGTGLAISARCRDVETAVCFSQFVAGDRFQRTGYLDAGGQPGHRSAWVDPENISLAGGYFCKTLPGIDRAFLRPRYPGYLRFQAAGGQLVHEFLKGAYSARSTLDRLNQLYLASLVSAA